MCLGIFLLRLILYETLCTSWTWVTASFPLLGSFQLLSLQIFSQALSLFSFWNPCNGNVSVSDVVPKVS